MIEIDYDKLADAIVQRLRVLPPADKIIWTADQCAEYLGMSRVHFVDRVSKSHHFPAAIKLPTDSGGRGHARWYAVDIQNWVSKQRSKN